MSSPDTHPAPHNQPVAGTAASARPFRILSLDGGGIRGYYTASLLARLLKHFETKTGRAKLDLGKGFDLIAGTSTGGILACALASGKRPDVIAKLYREKGPAIFPERFPAFALRPALLAWAYNHLKKPTGSPTTLKAELAAVLGEATLDSLWNSRQIALTIPSISVESYGPKVFKTPHLSRFTHDRLLRLVDVCLATSAAPLFFPPHLITPEQGYTRKDLFVDGGLWANNPSLVGLIEAVEILKAADSARPIHIFSFGTCSGTVDQSHIRSNPEGGLVTWKAGKDVTELAISSSAKAMDFMTKLLANAFTDSNRVVLYERVPDPEMTSGQQCALGLDKADEGAFEVMDQLSATNEARVLSDMQTSKTAYRHLAQLFESLPQNTAQ